MTACLKVASKMRAESKCCDIGIASTEWALYSAAVHLDESRPEAPQATFQPPRARTVPSEG